MIKQNVSVIERAVSEIMKAAAAEKCWSCGCLHSSLKAIQAAFPVDNRPADLEAVLKSARERLTDVKHACLGCNVCYPATAINALKVEGDGCTAEKVDERRGWPPVPGSYKVLRYHAPVAICTLTEDKLAEEISMVAGQDVAMVGTLQTENLGIERIVLNILANPHIRFLVLCGQDSHRDIGHLPGQSLLSLARSGIDRRSRIVGARGKRPFLRNTSRDAAQHFRQTVEVINEIGNCKVSKIIDISQSFSNRNPGPAEPFESKRVVTTLNGYIPKKVALDPAGYFVLFVDRARGLLSLEHYKNEGMLDVIVQGKSAAELYVPAIEKRLVTRLDHAAYLGRELARAEWALKAGVPYVQDAAPELIIQSETSSCECSTTCEEARP